MRISDWSSDVCSSDLDPAQDRRYMAAAIALSERGRGLSTPNPNVGCLIVKDGHVVGRGWTQRGGRPHAEAQALDEALDRRSEERRVGKECVSTCRYRGSPYH